MERQLLVYCLTQYKCDYLFYRYKGFYDYAKLKGVNVGEPVGLDVLVDGTVPTGLFICLIYNAAIRDKSSIC